MKPGAERAERSEACEAALPYTNMKTSPKTYYKRLHNENGRQASRAK